MRNVKFISLFAICGFVLSFVFGFFSHSSFLSILLKALIFSILFVLLGFLISFVFDKFLADPSDVTGFGDVADNSSKGSSESPTVGQNIDIIVKDEELPSSDTDNHFVVGDNHQMLKNTDIKEDSSSSAVEAATPQFVPIRNSENIQNFSGTEAKTSKEVDNTETVEQLEENIDTLPDMETLNVSQEGGSDDGASDTYNFSSIESSGNTYKKSEGSVPDVKDASLIAKAISTALAGEDE